MKLTQNDRDYLKSVGYSEEDMDQIERATTKTVYTLNNKEKISCMQAVELLGRKNFLCSIGRSAFHRGASRKTEDGKNIICFDSSKLFR